MAERAAGAGRVRSVDTSTWSADVDRRAVDDSPVDGAVVGRERRVQPVRVSRFQVEPDTLHGAAARVDDVSTVLDRASRGLSRVGTDAVGNPRLTRAVDEFLTNWEYALHRMGSAATAAAERLRAAAETYQATDDAVGAAAGRAL